MSKILLMKPELANLIAAGEVIERPASVIKELVENSIDANAKNIYVGVTDAGKGKILVKDDGTGMDKEDAKMCFLRHASSKIKTEFDLARIHTLGFRGEAIPSIAAVSKVTLITSTGDGSGTRITSSPDKELIVENAPTRKGTIFEVSNLFFNTPARLKYLKSNQTEVSAIIEMMEHLALGFPEICFTLTIDGKDVMNTSGRNDLLETIQKIYGNDRAKALYPIQKEDISFSFSGYTSKPEVNFSRRFNMMFFLNHRYIYDYKLNKALEDAYRDYLPPLRYPFTVICLNVDPSLIDVNVHPTKKEVRISMEDEMARSVRNTIIETLKYQKPIYSASEDEKTLKDLKIDEVFKVDDLKKEEEKKVEEFNYDPVRKNQEKIYLQDSIPFEPSYSSRPIKNEPISLKREEANFDQSLFETPTKQGEIDTIIREPLSSPEITPLHEENKKIDYSNIFDEESYSNKLPEMHPIGQVLDTYIICDSNDCFYLIDQHAAAERINFEKTEALFANVKTRIVPLIPITLDLSFKERQNYDDEHKKRLLDLNIVTEAFGDKTIKVTEIPSFLQNMDDEDIIRDMVTSILNDVKIDAVDLLRLNIANIACKKSIKANHHLSLVEMETLISDLAKCKNPANCPHGRPTLIKMTKADIEKIFRRSGF